MGGATKDGGENEVFFALASRVLRGMNVSLAVKFSSKGTEGPQGLLQSFPAF